MLTTEILIIGGGVIGSSIAYHLARGGHDVIVLERDGIAAEPSASWASAGGIRRQGRHRAEVALATEASRRWPTLAAELDADLGYRQSGHLRLAEREVYAQRLKLSVERQHRYGLSDVVFIDRQQVRGLLPGVTPNVVAGSFSPTEGYADPILTTRAFAAAAQRLGAKYLTHTKCESLIATSERIVGAKTSRDRVEAATTVLAAGAWSLELAATVGLELPLHVEALQMIRSTPAPADSLSPVLSSLGRKLSLKQLPSGSLLLGGGQLGDVLDNGGWRARPVNIERNWNDACAILPMVGQQLIERVWCGLEATSVDELPLVGPAPHPRSLYLAVGFSGHGFALAPSIGRAIADEIAGNLAPELAGLRPQRLNDTAP